MRKISFQGAGHYQAAMKEPVTTTGPTFEPNSFAAALQDANSRLSYL